MSIVTHRGQGVNKNVTLKKKLLHNEHSAHSSLTPDEAIVRRFTYIYIYIYYVGVCVW